MAIGIKTIEGDEPPSQTINLLWLASNKETLKVFMSVLYSLCQRDKPLTFY